MAPTDILSYVFGGLLTASILYFLLAWFWPARFQSPFHWKFALILSTLFLGLVALWPPAKKLKLGIDLSGGTILVYEIKQDSIQKNVNIEELVSALKKRVNPDGSKDIPIRPLGRDRIELILPNATSEDVEMVKQKLTTQGLLQFRILANRRKDDSAIQRALRPENLKAPEGYSWVRLGELVSGPEDTQSVKVADRTLTDSAQRWATNRYAGATVVLTGRDAANIETRKSFNVDRNTGDTLTLDKPIGLSSVSRYELLLNKSEIGGGLGEDNPNFAIRDFPRGKGIVERRILVKEPPDRMSVSGDDMSNVYSTESQFRPAVGFDFKSSGARKFGALTGANLPEIDGYKYHLAIVLDGEVQSAPAINDQIRDRGVITMGKSGADLNKEVDFLISVLRAGSLPGSLNNTPLQEEQIGPTLGRDTISKGITAIVISILVVPIFMILYYRLAGVIAVVALFLNMILLLGVMALLQASFTLPGLAGFALTIGMSVDANVLIFERMREEAERGASFAHQIRTGFSRAWTAILDSNVCTILSGAVLFLVGTEEVKGFAVTLIIGLIGNLFTAVFSTRVALEFLQRQGLKGVSMFKLFKNPNINFTKPRYYCMAVSAVLIAISLAAFFARGGASSTGDIYNIDFTGGTLITIALDPNAPEVQGKSESDRAAYVRATAGAVLPDSAVEGLNVAGAKERGLRFNIRTTEADSAKVQGDVARAFGSNLDRVTMEVGPGHTVPPRAADAPPIAVRDFAGGREYALSFRRSGEAIAEKPSRIAAAFDAVLAEAKVNAPADHFLVKAADTPIDEPGDTESKALILRTDLDPAQADALVAKLSQQLQNDQALLFERVENFGAAVAGESRNLALMAIIASWLIIIAYLWFRFKDVTYGLAAVIALVHDVLIALGAVALSRWFLPPGYKIDQPMIAAFLTLIGFSVNDTIVIFDRIRELKGKTPVLTEQMINLALNQTLSRTILTTLTAFLVVVILYFFGGEGLAPFSFCLLIGFISGTYSTVYIASPILIDWAGQGKKATATKDSSALATS
ncbi:MAG: protein translocase subunit SecF [Isosphaeraceae bacterium]